MNSDRTSLESLLRELRATPPDEALLSRLEAAADGSLLDPDPAAERFEARLRASRPAALPADFLADFEVVVRGVPFPAETKIVPFPGAAAPVRRPRPMWAAAAAVALVGAASALLAPPAKAPVSVASRTPERPVASSARGNFLPASFDRGVSEVRDEGVIWNSDSRPHSLVRVTFTDRLVLKDRTGRTIEYALPRVEYKMVPAKTD